MARIIPKLLVPGGLLKPIAVLFALSGGLTAHAALQQISLDESGLNYKVVCSEVRDCAPWMPNDPAASGPDSFLLSAHSRILPSRRRLGKRRMRRRS
jgi:hypothetical protein